MDELDRYKALLRSASKSLFDAYHALETGHPDRALAVLGKACDLPQERPLVEDIGGRLHALCEAVQPVLAAYRATETGHITKEQITKAWAVYDEGRKAIQ